MKSAEKGVGEIQRKEREKKERRKRTEKAAARNTAGTVCRDASIR